MERLIRQAGEAGMNLMGLRRKGQQLQGCIAEHDVPRLCAMAEKGGWRVILGRRTGLGRVTEALWRRWLLAAGCLLVFAGVVCASQIMWRVEITGAGTYEADIRQYLAQEGIEPLRWKHSIDTAQLRDSLEWRYPKITWIETGWRGLTLQIRVAEGTAPGETLSIRGSGDVIAERDGIVSSIVTVAGTPMVKMGELVRAGQVLIAGEERTDQGKMRQVTARGVVMARVWDAASVTMAATERRTVYTGRQYKSCAAAFPWFDLWQNEASGFEQEDISVRTMPLGGLFFPLCIRWQNHMEACISLEHRDLEQVKAEAGTAALRKLREKVGTDDDFVDKWVDYSMIDSEQVCAVAYAERVIDIARNEWTADE